MTVTAASFRGHLPEFADAGRFPNAVIDYWIAIAVQLVNAARWSTLTDMGVESFVAHQISLERQAIDAADAGGVPGLSTGIINSKSVDKVSVGYDTQGGAELDAGHWNLTIYGKRFIRFSRMMGAGPVQVGVTACGPGGAWEGPWTANFPNPSG